MCRLTHPFMLGKIVFDHLRTTHNRALQQTTIVLRTKTSRGDYPPPLVMEQSKYYKQIHLITLNT